MNHDTSWNKFERHAITIFCFDLLSRGHDDVANTKSELRDHVAFLTIWIVEKRETCAAIWIVFNCSNCRRNIKFICDKINDANVPACAAAAMTHGDFPRVVAATG